ncbi:UDP-N-acetylmuramoyl-L-alanyl-D-glutamate--2,6-diaminopimelate ligase [Methylothermus subterraneus]
MRRRLDELLPGVFCPPIEIGGLCEDSGAVRPGDAFVALSGVRRHGAEFAQEAENRGAVAVLYDPAETEWVNARAIPAIAVPGLKQRLGEIAARFYGHPSRAMEVIGVTGTNGKTSSTWFLAQALAGGVMGTLGWGRPPALAPTAHTTAPAIETQRRLAKLRAQGVGAVAMEVSSHALDQGRVAGVEFDFALWTNLSRDHLDYHPGIDAYRAAKLKLFRWPTLKAAVLNLDDPAWPHFWRAVAPQAAVIGYGVKGNAPFPCLTAAKVAYRPDGIAFEAVWGKERVSVRVPLLGEFNLANTLAVLATLLARGETLGRAVARLKTIAPVPGRMECFRAEGRPQVVVDYAHTPAALELALRSLRRHCRGQLWVVFGCGGERDRGKRKRMGKIAETLADQVILTDDNPRGEPAEAILADIRAGMRRTPLVIRDRREAIVAALRQAGAMDVVLVAGKGHEEVQEVQGEKRPFSDRKVVAEWLQEALQCV